MYYYALVDSNNICTAVYAMPSPISGDSYIQITEELYNDSTLIGKKYVDGEWVTVQVYYYAILDDRDIVTNVYQSETEMAAADNLVPITSDQYNDSTLIGKYYDRENGTFIEPTISVLAQHSSDEIQYKDQEKWLSTKLDEVDTAIENRYTKEEADAKYALAGSSGATMTANEILTALKTVDGADSELDADTLDGQQASDFAAADHTHTEYAPTSHTHSEYASADHTHTGYAAADHTHSEYAAANHTHSDYAPVTHTHSEYAASAHGHSQSDIVGLVDALSGKASTSHTHSEYASASHTHSGYAATSHTHTQSDISGLSSALSGKADASHTHSGYASTSHTHSNYFEKSGGTITGETNFSGGLVRVKGVQTLYHSGNQMVLASDSMGTKICGSSIYSSQSIQVSSDKRLKENICDIDKKKLSEFLKQVKVVSYRYIGEPEEVTHIGVIAQQLLEIDEDIAKYFVKKDGDGYYAVDYSALALAKAFV